MIYRIDLPVCLACWGVPSASVGELAGYIAAENCNIEPGDTVAIRDCGPVARFVIQGAWMLKAGRVIGIDRVPERLAVAREKGRAEPIDFSKEGVHDRLQEMTSGRGPDRGIDAVGCEAHAAGSLDSALDAATAAVMLTTDRAHVATSKVVLRP